MDDFILDAQGTRHDPEAAGLGHSSDRGMEQASIKRSAPGLAAGDDAAESVYREAAEEQERHDGLHAARLYYRAGLWIATRLVSGIRIDDACTLVLAGVLLGIVNAIVRPIAIILTLPITILTLGLFLLVVNTAMVAWSRRCCRDSTFPAASGRHLGPRDRLESPVGSARP